MSSEEGPELAASNGSYRDTVRDMMNDYKASNAATMEATEAPEEDILNDVLDMEENEGNGEPAEPVNLDEADALLADDDVEMNNQDNDVPEEETNAAENQEIVQDEAEVNDDKEEANENEGEPEELAEELAENGDEDKDIIEEVDNDQENEEKPASVNDLDEEIDKDQEDLEKPASVKSDEVEALLADDDEVKEQACWSYQAKLSQKFDIIQCNWKKTQVSCKKSQT